MSDERYTLRKNGEEMATVRIEISFTREELDYIKRASIASGIQWREQLRLAASQGITAWLEGCDDE